MSPDEPRLISWHHLTPWRSAVLGSFVCLMVGFAILNAALDRIEANSQRGITAICVEVKFLENSADTTRDLIRAKPYAPEANLRRASLVRLEGLIRELRAVVPGCEPLKP